MSGIVFGEYQPSETVIARGATVIIGIFFDGTGNNRKNVRAYKAYHGEEIEMDEKEDTETYKKAYKKHKNDSRGDNSYNSDESNVSRLEPNYINDDVKVFKLYIEGIGTESFKGDATIGYVVGKGSTGVPTRVAEACKKAVENILASKKIESDSTDEKGFKVIDSVIFDVYGFSRGAVAARHFVSQVKKLPHYSGYTKGQEVEVNPAYGYLGKYLKLKKTTVNNISIGFAGLYDSVPHYGTDQKDDVAQLKLNQMFYAKKTVHLIAQDEIRANFNLVGIDSAGAKGLTISMPGVHSDVGGGYLENIPEEKKLLWDLDKDEEVAQNRRTNFIAEGWYKNFQIEVKNVKWRHEVWGARENLTNKYSVIALQLMAWLSDEYDAKINKSDLENDFKAEGALLQEVHKRLKAELEQKYSKKTTKIDLLKFSREQNQKEILEKNKVFVRRLEMAKKAKRESLIIERPPEIARDNTSVVIPRLKLPIQKKEITFKPINYGALSDTELIKELRNQFLHVSASYDNMKPSSWWQYGNIIELILRTQEPMAQEESGERTVHDDTENKN